MSNINNYLRTQRKLFYLQQSLLDMGYNPVIIRCEFGSKIPLLPEKISGESLDCKKGERLSSHH